MERVLIKLTLWPYGNYSGAAMVDYKIVNKETAKVISDFLKIFGDNDITFFDGRDNDCKLSRVNMIIIDDQNIMNAYHLLSENNIVDGTYYIYDIVVNKLMNIGNIDEMAFEPTEEELIKKWNSNLGG